MPAEDGPTPLRDVKLTLLRPGVFAYLSICTVVGTGYMVIGAETAGMALLMLAAGIVLGRFMGVREFA